MYATVDALLIVVVSEPLDPVVLEVPALPVGRRLLHERAHARVLHRRDLAERVGDRGDIAARVVR